MVETKPRAFGGERLWCRMCQKYRRHREQEVKKTPKEQAVRRDEEDSCCGIDLAETSERPAKGRVRDIQTVPLTSQRISRGQCVWTWVGQHLYRLSGAAVRPNQRQSQTRVSVGSS